MAPNSTDNRETRDLSPFQMHGVVVVIVLAVAVILTHGWMASLEYQMDDYRQIADAWDSSRPPVLMGANGSGSEAQGPGRVAQFWRPLLHGSFVLDVQLFGANPFASHTMSIFLHLLAALLLHHCLSRMWKRDWLALAPAIVFAIMPGKWGAVSWVAARGDQLVTLFFLLALTCLLVRRQGGGRGWSVLVFASVLASILSKETGVICPILLLVVDVFLPRNGRKISGGGRIGFRSLLLATIPLYLALRLLMFDNQAFVYAGHERAMSPDIAWRMATDMWSTFCGLVSSTLHHSPGTATPWISNAAGGMVIVAFLAWCTHHRGTRLKLAAFLFLLYSISSIPALRFYHEASVYNASRLFYLPGIVVAVAAAVPLVGIRRRSRALGVLTCCHVIFLLAVNVHGALQDFHAQRDASELIRHTRQDLKALAATPSGRNVGYLVLDLPAQVGHAPTFGYFLFDAMQPPFVDPPVLARSARNLDIYLASGEIYQAPQDGQVLRWDPSDHHLHAASPVLPKPVGNHPILLPDRQLRPLSIIGGLRPRDVVAMELVFAEPNPEPFDLTMKFMNKQGEQAYETDLLEWRPLKFGSSDRFLVNLMLDQDWLFQGEFFGLEFDLKAGNAPRIERIETGATPAKIELIAPTRLEEIPASGPPPGFRFRDPGGFPWLRVVYILGDRPVTWTLPRERFKNVDGDLVFDPSQPGTLPGEPGRPWHLLGDFLDIAGIRRFELLWSVQGFRGLRPPSSMEPGFRAHRNVQGMSETGIVVIVP